MSWQLAHVTFSCCSVSGISCGFTVLPLSSVKSDRSAVLVATSERVWHDSHAAGSTSVLRSLGRHLVVRHIHIAVGRLKPCGVGVTAHAVQIAVTRRNFATCVGHGSALGLVTGGTIALRRPGEGRRAFGRIRQRVSAVVAYAVWRAGRKSRGEQQRCKHSKASSYMHRYRFLVFKRQWGRLQTSPRNFRDSSGSRRPYSLRRLRHCSQCCLHR